ncbi:MBL fold metallo-hydrolase [Tomitella gaofuii]|uniref:MBL fold metallo-hydrolase n=1 Tax=Tomitella gaofuii TaxID=2760083 RepID=UPI001F3DD012|nr:MBL fold metallo-hydrolase [Tomitella gaofuii]
MCGGCGGGARQGMSRRALLGRAGAAGAALGLGMWSAGGAAAAPVGSASLGSLGRTAPSGDDGRFSVVLLGTMAGPPILPDRSGIASAVVVDGRVYVVDCGRGSCTQYVRSGLRLDAIEAIFLTHLHADHITDYYNFFMLGGNMPNRFDDHITRTVKVYGPGSAGGLPPAFGGAQVPTIGSDPTPGTAQMTRDLHDAYAYTSNIFLRDSGVADVRTLVDARDIAVPEVGANFQATAPDMDPFVVYEDDRVQVSAILVPHGVCYPAFAFRFDTDYGSVVFSGDTTYTDNIPRLAQGTDLLVHEAINVEGSNMPPAMRSHMLESHVEVQKVGAIAERCAARRLVLSHIGDISHGTIDSPTWRAWAQAGYLGRAEVGEDLQRIVLA